MDSRPRRRRITGDPSGPRPCETRACQLSSGGSKVPRPWRPLASENGSPDHWLWTGCTVLGRCHTFRRADQLPESGGFAMRRLLFALVSTAALVMAFSSTVVAGDVKVRDSGSPDSGTCGNDSANDTFTRELDVQQSGGTFVLTEFFKDGHFVTVAGFSPGGCQTGSDHGQLVDGGISGSFHGFLSGTVTGGSANPNAAPPDPCPGPSISTSLLLPRRVPDTP